MPRPLCSSTATAVVPGAIAHTSATSVGEGFGYTIAGASLPSKSRAVLQTASVVVGDGFTIDGTFDVNGRRVALTVAVRR